MYIKNNVLKYAIDVKIKSLRGRVNYDSAFFALLCTRLQYLKWLEDIQLQLQLTNLKHLSYNMVSKNVATLQNHILIFSCTGCSMRKEALLLLEKKIRNIMLIFERLISLNMCHI